MVDPTFHFKEKIHLTCLLGYRTNEKENNIEKWENYIKKENTIN